MATAAALSAWYRAHARGVLVRSGDRIVDELEASCTKEGPGLALPMCVVGVAGVGKSTLLNSLISDRLALLPQGGVGSLTAAPIRIVHAGEAYLAIRRSAGAVRALVAALSSSHGPPASSLQEARLLVRGTQFDDAAPEYLREVLGAALRGGVSGRAEPRDRGRLSVLASVLSAEAPDAWSTWWAGAQLPEIRHELEHNAAGFLSPLAAEIELGWTAELLGDLQLVDLPGLGVMHDIHRYRTQSALAAARAVMLVVDRSGIAEVAAEAVRPVFQRLAASADTDASRVIVAVTHLDQIACERRGSEPAGDRRTWQTHFDELGAAARALIRAQLAQQLAAAGLGGDAHQARRTALAARVRIIHVAPLEHRRYHRRDPEEPSRLSSEDGGGVSRLRGALVELGREWRSVVNRKLTRALERALGPRSRQLAELHRALQQGVTRTHQDEEVT